MKTKCEAEIVGALSRAVWRCSSKATEKNVSLLYCVMQKILAPTQPTPHTSHVCSILINEAHSYWKIHSTVHTGFLADDMNRSMQRWKINNNLAVPLLAQLDTHRGDGPTFEARTQLCSWINRLQQRENWVSFAKIRMDGERLAFAI